MLSAPPASRTRRVWLNASYGVLIALAAGGSAYVLSDAGATAEAPDTVAVAAPSVERDRVTSLWFGDGVTDGCCRTDPDSPTMAQVAASRLGWAEPQVVGAKGTGYLTAATDDGERAGPFPQRIQDAVDRTYYDVVVVAGGTADAASAFDAKAFGAAVRAVLAQVRTSVPDAAIVVLGAYSPDGQGYDELRDVQQREAERVGATFVDQVALGWMRGRPELLSDDDLHPDDAGQRELGLRMAEALQEALPPELTSGPTADAA